jgi:HTH-type transcriptional regulator/antitoxin HipB
MIIRTTGDLAHLIRDRRSRLRLTQANLAELVGVSRKWIVDVESGNRAGDVSLILRTIKALGMDLEVRDRVSSAEVNDVDIDQIVQRSKRTTR